MNTLFDPIPPYQEHSVTSIDAAKSMIEKTPNLREKVLGLLRRETLTDEQIAKRLDLNPSTARPRRIELVRMGLVFQVGIVQGSSGRSMATWAATPNTGNGA